MKLIGVITVIGALVLLSATIADSIAKESFVYDRQCILKGQNAEIESYKECGSRTNSVVCFNFDRDDCLVSKTGNPPTGIAYMAGVILGIAGIIGFVVMWLKDREYKHSENMEALS